MKQHTALIVASIVTAFTLVVVGGVAARVAQPSAQPPTSAPAGSPAPDTSVQTAYLQQVNAYYQQREAAYQQQLAVDQQHAAVYQDRELAYQQLVRQANQQLQQAYNQLAATKKRVRVRAQAPQTPTAQPSAAPYAVSPESAAAIALAAAPGATLLAPPDLVNFQGTVAYEVRLNRGNVYVDATTGAVLYNGAAAPAPQTVNASSGSGQQGGGSHQGGDDHSGGGGDGEGGD